VDAIKRKNSNLEPGTPVRKSKSNTTNKNTIKMIDKSEINDYQIDSNADVSNRKIIKPHSRKNSLINNKVNDNNNNSSNSIINNPNNNSSISSVNNSNSSNNNSYNSNQNLNNNNSNTNNITNNKNFNNSNNNTFDNNFNISNNNNNIDPNEIKDKNINNVNSNKINNSSLNNNSINSNNNSASTLNNSNNPNNSDSNIINKIKNLRSGTNKKTVQFNVKDPPDPRDINNDNMDISDNENNEKPEKRTILANKSNIEPYNLANDLANCKCNISFAQILDICPKLRTELSKDLKLEKLKISNSINFNNNFIYNYESTDINNSKFKDDDLGMVFASVDNVENKLLVDSGSNLNLISSNYFNKLPGEYETIGICHGRICEALGDDTITDAIVVRLCVTINNYSFYANFCIVNHDSNYFDLLIGLKTIADNYLFIHPISKCLCRFNSYSTFDIITPLLEDQEVELLTCFIKYFGEEKHINSLNYNNNTNNFKNLIDDSVNAPQIENKILQDSVSQDPKDDSLSPIEYIHSNKFQSQIDPPFKSNITKLLIDFIDIVATSSEQLTPSKLNPHHIQLFKNAVPFKSKFYKLNRLKSDALKIELTKLINKGLIVPSKSAWSSPIVLVIKKNGKWRLCSDYRKLNSMTVPDSYSLPNIDEIFSSLGGAKIFSTLDLFSGYHQIRMAEDSIDLTSFTTKFGNFVYKVMPFGLTGAPATFQREMNRILFDLLGKCVFVFLDDILIFSNSIDEHVIHLKQVFEIFRKYKVKINIEKCCFFKEEVEVLGHVVSKNGLKTIKSKVDAVSKWIKPENISELRSFLGSVGYYRKFINNFAMIAAPLYKLLRKNVPFIWEDIHQNSFNKLKDALISAPILRYPDFTKQFIIRTDACKDGIGGVLLQKDEIDGIEYPIHFISRTLTKAEFNYSITDLEGTAVYYCTKEFKYYISGNKYETLLYTDHKPLIGLFSNKEPNNMRQIRWCITISMLRIKILYEPGKRNCLADALSRIKITTENVAQEDKENKENLDNEKTKLDIKIKNEENKNLIKTNTPQINSTLKTKNISYLKIKNKNLEIINFSKFQKLREKWWYIDKLNFSKNFEKPTNSTNSNISESNHNIFSNINFNKLKLNQNKLKKFLIQLIQFKHHIIDYYSNILANINSYILQYTNFNNSMYEKHKINDICQLKLQLTQLKNKIIEYIDNILENKSKEYNNNTYYIYALNNNKDNNANNNNNENQTTNEDINNENNQNEDTNDNNTNIVEFMQKFIDDHIITIDGDKYLREKDNLRKIITTNEEKFNLIWKAHAIGHEGFDKTYERLRKSFYWKGMTVDIKRFISCCENCQLNKKNEIPDPTEKYATPVEAPFSHLGLDIIGPLPETSSGNQYIIVIVDYFTKWVEAQPLSSITSRDVVNFLSQIFARFGTPNTITTDNGVQFNSDFTKIFLDLYDVYIKFTVTYHPESNGLTENRNREIGKLLRLLANKEKEWDLVLPFALWALRTSKNSVTKYSSFELVYGRQDQQPFELSTTLPNSNVQGSEEELLIEKFIDHYKWVIDACNNIKKNNQYWETRREEITSMNKQNEIKPGDLVKVRNFTRHKLDPYFVGPFEVLSKQFNTTKLIDPNTKLPLERPVHLKNIIKFNSTTIP